MSLRSMKVRMLKDWSFHKKGDTASVYEPTALNWINTGIAERFAETRSVEVAAVEPPAERADARPRKAKRL